MPQVRYDIQTTASSVTLGLYHRSIVTATDPPVAATGQVRQIQAELVELGTTDRAINEKRYLKSDLFHYGVTVPQLRKISKRLAREGCSDHDSLMDSVAALWEVPTHETRFLAAALLGDRKQFLSVADLVQLEAMLQEANTWALVDTIVPHPVGAISTKAPTESTVTLDRWATDANFWLRRSALLAHLVPLSAGHGDWDRFTRYADQMLHEREFFVRKAIGWVLRDTSRRRPDLVRDWVAPRTQLMSGVTIREAVRRLPEPERDELMQAYREHRPAGPPHPSR